MAWAKIDDGWWSHPKVMGLSLSASGLWARALSWSCHQRRDMVPETFLAMVGADAALAGELVEAGLWHETDDGWRIHDWAEYQDMSLSEKRAEAGRKGGARSGASRRSKQTDRSKTEAKPKQAKQTVEANDEAGPSRPDPTHENIRSSGDDQPPETLRLVADDGVPAGKVGSDDDPDFVAFWSEFPRKVAKGQARKAWRAAVRKVDPSVIVAAAERYRRSPTRDPDFTAHPATWLNGERWGDETVSAAPVDEWVIS